MNELKEQGNEAFKQSQYKKAAQYYTQAIETVGVDLNKLSVEDKSDELIQLVGKIKSNECLQKCFNNRSQCYLRLEKYKKAEDDATKGRFLPTTKNMRLLFCEFCFFV